MIYHISVDKEVSIVSSTYGSGSLVEQMSEGEELHLSVVHVFEGAIVERGFGRGSHGC